MHPVTQDRRRLGFYALAWTPIVGMLVATLVSRTNIAWDEGLVLGLLLGVVYAVLGLPLWYVCRANPLGGQATGRALATHAVSSVLYALLLNVTARVLARVLEDAHPSWDGLASRVGANAVMILFLGVLVYLINAAFYYLLLGFEASREAERRQDQLQILAGKAELRALKAQINPHFLFNCLNSISALTTGRPREAREMCVRLADFLRKSLGMGERTAIAVQEELTLIEDYLAVERIRLGERLRVRMEFSEEARACRVPPLILQPLVENAVLHGVATLTEGGEVILRGERLQDRLRIEAVNPYDPDAPRRPGSGVGMANVRARLAAHYGKDGRIDVETTDGRFRVVMSLPARFEEES